MTIAAHLNNSLFRSWILRVLVLSLISCNAVTSLTFKAFSSVDGAWEGGKPWSSCSPATKSWVKCTDPSQKCAPTLPIGQANPTCFSFKVALAWYLAGEGFWPVRFPRSRTWCCSLDIDNLSRGVKHLQEKNWPILRSKGPKVVAYWRATDAPSSTASGNVIDW